VKPDFTKLTDAANRLWRSRLGRVRTSTVVLIVAFIALLLAPAICFERRRVGRRSCRRGP
jgi:hypothetical protein